MTNTTLLEQYIEKSGYKKSYIAAQLGITAYGFTLKILLVELSLNKCGGNEHK